MLLYNQRKEFVGIDEDDLHGLGFENINELKSESSDFADLFVKKPGYIHNFKNFSWIDFILHSESDESKAIIHAKGKNYSCSIHITPFYFTSDESGFAVVIKNLRALKGAEDAQASKDLEAAGGIQATPEPMSRKETPEPMAPAAPIQEETPAELDISLDDIQVDQTPEEFSPEVESSEPELPSFEADLNQELSEPDPLDIPEPQEIDLAIPTENEFGAPVDIDYNAPLTLDDDVMKDDFSDELKEVEEAPAPVEEEVVHKEEAPMLGDYVTGAGSEHLSELVTSGNYQYDPQVAADELGLPVDLIEEFIGDFIDQAHEFHDDLFASVQSGDFDNVQILSHKLKGVAANLRVEDAFDVLSVVNTSKDTEEVMPNLTQFYKIIAKLEGKEVPAPAPAAQAAPAAPSAPVIEPEAPVLDTEPASVEEEPDYDIGIKQPDDGPMLIDEEVTPVSNDEDLYEDLLATPTEETGFSAPTMPEEQESFNDLSVADEDLGGDDLYDDLLGTPEVSPETETLPESSFEPPVEDDLYDDLIGAPESTAQIPDETAPEENPLDAVEDDLYDDLLGAAETPALPEEDIALEELPEVENVQEESIEAEEVEIPAMNFDAQRSANELGIPLDIVNEFIQDFKEQVRVHQEDFDNAIANGNIQEVKKTATLLKGMSDNLRLNEISEVLKGLQQENDINNTAQAFANLKAYADQL